MAIADVVGTGQSRVRGLRSELDRVRDVLDRTDAVLEVTDDALVKAESAFDTGRRWAPRILVGGVVLAGIGTAVTVGAIVAIVVRRRRRRLADDAT